MASTHRRGKAFTLVCAAALAGGCAMENAAPRAQSAAGARQCFLASQVNGFQPVDDDTVHVTVGVRDVYELQLVGYCPDVDWEHRIGIRSTGGGSWVCAGFDAELLVPSPTGTQRCPVASVRRLTPAEVQAARDRR